MQALLRVGRDCPSLESPSALGSSGGAKGVPGRTGPSRGGRVGPSGTFPKIKKLNRPGLDDARQKGIVQYVYGPFTLVGCVGLGVPLLPGLVGGEIKTEVLDISTNIASKKHGNDARICRGDGSKVPADKVPEFLKKHSASAAWGWTQSILALRERDIGWELVMP
jgi:hypothetical protein